MKLDEVAFGLLLAAAVVLVSCGDPPTAPGEVLTSEISLEPHEIPPGGALTATVRISNPTDRSVSLGSPNSCLFVPSVSKNDATFAFEGTRWGCLTVITTFTLEPHETLERRWEIRTDNLGAPPPTGEYLLEVNFNVPLPTLRHRFHIR